jgi:peptidoglycan/xylan/chitin deacetylase (PgdA/CDA1 family)
MKNFVFRDDDICPFGALNALEAVDQVHIDKNVPVTLGVVAHPDAGASGNELLNDTDTLSYLRSLARDPLFEIAQHGYTHRDASSTTVGASAPRMVGASPYQETLVGASYSEYKGVSYTDQYNSIKQGRADITEALGVTPTTFIPPWNSGDTNTLKACTALGFKLYSTAYEDFSVTDATMQGIRVQAASFSMGWNTTDEWQTNMATLTSDTDSALNSASSGQDFVLFYHYWQFCSSDGSVDPVRISLFEQYVDHLKSRGDVQFTTLGNQDELGISDLFLHGTDDALWYEQRSGQYWSAWASLGGQLNSSPAAVSWGNGRIDVFVNMNSSLWHKWYNGGTWSSWESLGGQFASNTGPAVSSWAAGRLDVFAVGTDNRLWHKYYQNSWSGWESLGGNCTSSPAATSSTSGRIDVFAPGTDDAIWQRAYSSNAWGGWTSRGGQIAAGTGPAACS